MYPPYYPPFMPYGGGGGRGGSGRGGRGRYGGAFWYYLINNIIQIKSNKINWVEVIKGL
jgi:hypothetical protein